ncbi:zinc finger protein 853-like [Armigeres subalbatus]|uniref:zinc finger protein 853-like n=1 Tax=Armigeres subalbatus TaxID=124917 RepID=UPI002ED270C0
MSNGSVASAEKNSRRKSDAPGEEGASCGTCRRVDTSRMVQCDDCDAWFHYGCVNVDDSIQYHDWSCNGCMRTSLERQRRVLSEQLESLEQRQMQWQQEQQMYLEQMDNQRKLEQRQKQQELQQLKRKQFDQQQIEELQLQQDKQSDSVTTGTVVPLKSLGAIPKQQQMQWQQEQQKHQGQMDDQQKLVQQLKQKQLDQPIGELPLQQNQQSEPVTTRTEVPSKSLDSSPNQGKRKEPLASSTTNDIRPSGTYGKASSKGSKHSMKVRQLQLKALEERQALEKRQLEERLALEREMLDTSESEEESVVNLEKIDEWLEKTENMGNSLNETPLPVYNENLRMPISLQGATGVRCSHSI